MDYLTSNEIDALKHELERQLVRLTRSMRVTEEAAGPVELDQTAVGRLSRMDSLQNQGMAKNLKEREGVRLAHIQGALQRIEEGTYGVCLTCEAALPFGRLYVVPEAPVCATCGGGP